MKKDKHDIRISINLDECGTTDKVTADMGFLNETAIAFAACAQLYEMRGFDALAARFRRRADQITRSLESRGLYDEIRK